MATTDQIKKQMEANSKAWFGADKATQAKLHEANLGLSKQLASATGTTSSYNSKSGTYSYSPSKSSSSTSSSSKAPSYSYEPTTSWQDRLDQVKGGNTDLFNQEIDRAKYFYDFYKGQGQMDKANSAHQWANQLRDAAGVSNQYDRTTGASLQPQPIVPQIDPMQLQAQKLAEAQIAQMKNAYQSQLQSMKQQQDLARQQIAFQLESGRKGLDDKYFQKYLNGRQNLADRGLNAGFTSDMNTRLLLGKQSDLADLYQQAMLSEGQIGAEFGGKIAEMEGNIGNLGIQKDALIENYLSQFKKDKLEQDKFAWDQQESLLPYMYAKASDMLPYQMMTANQKAQLGFDYFKEMLPYQYMTANQQAQLGLDYNKLSETSRHNQALESISSFNASTNAARLNETIRNNDLKAQQFIVTTSNGQLKQQATVLQAVMSQRGNQLKTLIDLKKSGNGGTNIDSQIQEATRQYELAQRSLTDLMELTTPAMSPQDAGLYNGTNPSSTFKAYSGFNNGKKGGGYNNYYKLQQAPKAGQRVTVAQSAIEKAVQAKGVPESWIQPMLELAGRESSWNPTAQNPKSTAYGLFQFLNSTWKGKKTSDPYGQALEAVDYIRQRYGTPERALAFWDKNKWY